MIVLRDMTHDNIQSFVVERDAVLLQPQMRCRRFVREKMRKIFVPFLSVQLCYVLPTETLGESAARIRSIRPPEPYKGKGIKYIDEHVIRKAGKAAKAGAK
mgnify:CR=1 FL=1